MSIIDSLTEPKQLTNNQEIKKDESVEHKEGMDKQQINNDVIDVAERNNQNLRQNDSLQDRAAQAVDGRENIQHELPEISNLILRNGNRFDNDQTGNLVYKDDNNAIVQIGKNIGLTYDVQNFKNIELGERVTVSMVQDEHRVMAAADFERQSHDAGGERAVELDNEMH